MQVSSTQQRSLISTEESYATDITRTLIISSYDLGKTSKLLLTFDDPQDGMFVDKFPVGWKVSEFGAKGSYAMVSAFKNQLAFCKPLVVGDKVVAASTWANIKIGQKTDLTKPSRDRYEFTQPTPGGSGRLQAVNQTRTPQDMSIGFENTNTMHPPVGVLYFKEVSDGSQVSAKFTPVLRAYITSDYEEGQILRNAIHPPPIWIQDLEDLPEVTNWILIREPVSGKYEIKRSVAI